MNFQWTPEQQEVISNTRSFAKKHLNREALSQRADNNQLDTEGWNKCAEFGIHGLPISSDFGGLGLDALTTVGVLESLGYGCHDNGLLFSLNAQLWTFTMPLQEFGTEEQKARFLPSLCDGSIIGGNAMTEPDSGSDAFSLKTKAVKEGSSYILSGNKTFITNAPIADYLLVYANLENSGDSQLTTAFIVPTNSDGFSKGRVTEKMGISTSPMSEVYLDEVVVPEENRLGTEGGGRTIFTHSLTWERACILAPSVGTMERLFEISLAYAKSRKQFGKPIGQFQRIADRIVDMRLRIDSCRSQLYKSAWLRDQGRTPFLESAAAKLTISENWIKTAEDAIQIHGGYGYMKEYGLERELRDAISSRIYSGTSEIQRTIIASLLGL